MKLKALTCYKGVMRPYPHPRSDEAIKGGEKRTVVRRLDVYAEAFECPYMRDNEMYAKGIKRMIHCIIAAVGLLILLNPFLIIAIAIEPDSLGAIIFKQVRLRKGQEEFTIYKFRTMCVAAFEKGGIARKSKDARITKDGNFLRRTRLNETP